MEYTYTETDLEKKIQQMKNNGCLPPMQLGEWELLNDGGIGHYYLCLRDYELTHLLHTHVLLGEDVDAAFWLFAPLTVCVSLLIPNPKWQFNNKNWLGMSS